MTSEKKTTTSANYTNEQLRATLFYVEELMERCQCPFFLLGDIANNVRLSPDAYLSGSRIVVGIRKNEWKTAKVLRDILLPGQTDGEDHVDLLFQGIPIHIVLVETTDPLFLHPDVAFFERSQFLLPNPFSTYWEKRETYD